jgi:hypothetical protein
MVLQAVKMKEALKKGMDWEAEVADEMRTEDYPLAETGLRHHDRIKDALPLDYCRAGRGDHCSR